MINCIIFSKNRALQLDALLQSIQNNCNIFDNISVLYTYTSDEFEQGYKILKTKYDGVNFVKEKSFENDTKRLLIDYPYTCFMVDDDIIYRQLTLNAEQVKEIVGVFDVCCFSLRLGINYKYYTPQGLLKKDQYIRWDWRGKQKALSYPLSLDGHIFRTKFISQLIDRISFTNPNKLEAKLQKYQRSCTSYMTAPLKSVLVGNPVNRVSNTSKCTFGTKYNENEEQLNDYFLKGFRIDLDKMDFSDINDIHKEIQLVLKR